jgi:hypothetical protein
MYEGSFQRDGAKGTFGGFGDVPDLVWERAKNSDWVLPLPG